MADYCHLRDQNEHCCTIVDEAQALVALLQRSQPRCVVTDTELQSYGLSEEVHRDQSSL